MMTICEDCGKIFWCYYDSEKKRIKNTCTCHKYKDGQTKLREFGVE